MTFAQKMGQLGGVIRYEALIQFRRRTIILFGVFFLIGSIGLTSMLQSGNMGMATQEILRVEFEGENIEMTYRIPATGETRIETFPIDSDQGRWIPRWYGDVDFPQVMATWKTFAVLSASLVLLVVAAPPMLAEVIPLDKQYRMRELMDVTPLERSTYLMGKLLGTWLGIGVAIVVCAILFGVYAWGSMGVFDVWTYARFWLLIVLPLALIITGFAVVVPAIANSRRIGILIGMGLLVLSVRMAMSIVPGSFMVSLFAPSQSGSLDATYEEIVAGMFTSLLGHTAPYAVLLVIVTVIIWAWMRFKESYA